MLRRSSPDFATLGLSEQRSFFGTGEFFVYILIYIVFRYPKNRLVIIFSPEWRNELWDHDQDGQHFLKFSVEIDE